MNRIDDMLERLPPEKRALLELRLARETQRLGISDSTIQPRDRSQPAPLSFAQQRLWFLNCLGADDGQYNVTRAIRVEGPLDRKALSRALGELVTRQEILRTTYVLIDEKPHQRVDPPPPFELYYTDLSTLDSTARQSILHQGLEAESARPFDLTTDLMMRAHLYRQGPDNHTLLLIMHHVASDAWSMGIALRELAALYAAEAQQQVPALSELPFQYADYAAWERQRLDGSEIDDALTYWCNQLAELPILDLPSDRPRPSIPSYRGGQVPVTFPRPLTDGLRRLAQTEDATLYMVLLTLLAVLLARYSRQTDIVIGSPVAGRGQAGTESLIGPFINTLVMRCGLAGDPTFREALCRVRETVLEAFGHQELPFERLVEALNPERDRSRNPLTQIMLILNNTPTSHIELGGLSFTQIPVETHTSKFDLTLDLGETADGLAGFFEYASDLFDHVTLERLSAQFRHLAAAVASDPACTISKLPLLSQAERERLLFDWNATGADYDRTLTLDQAVQRQCQAHPNSTAVVCGDERLSYAELDARATELARFLQQHGIGAETPVGICLHRSPRMIVALLGVLKAGACYVPLDPAFPRERLSYMLEDSGAPILLTEVELAEWLSSESSETEPRTICLDRDWQQIQAAEGTLQTLSGAESIAYTIYTSGSTGKPKGVQIPHRAVINFLDSMRREPGLSAEDRLLSVTTLSFDIAVLELFLPLTTGAQVILVSRDVAYDGYRLAAAIETHGATVMQATPATWRMLLEAGWLGDQQLKVLCGGEALPLDLAKQLLGRVGSLWNMYGPTEATVWSSTCRIESVENGLTVGRPIANTRIYLLDEHHQPVPTGVAGELFIGGDGLARGYLNREALTAERFLPDPFCSQPGARMYATGDLARYRADGRIEILGRLDFQVKIRGFRIELGEIETALNALPGVANSVVVAQPDASAGHRLVAYVVATDQDQPPTVMDMRHALLAHLPDYMVPSYIVHLAQLPLTPNGKIDRLSLPPVDQSDLVLETEYVPPESPFEQTLAEICADLLGLDQVSIDANFFALGGHSLLATQLATRIRSAYNVHVPLRVFFERSTLRSLAAYIRDAAESGSLAPALDHAITRIWARVLELEAVPADTSFFELGGSHEQAATMLSHIEAQFDTRLPLATLYKDPTVRGLAAALRKDDWGTQWVSMVAVSPDGQRRPFFCIHGDPSALAPYIHPDQPYYWLHHAQDGSLVGYATVEEIAHDHIKEIRAVQPHGPYLLGGFSFGGVLAFEVARRLCEDGQQVDMLALFDPPRPPASVSAEVRVHSERKQRKPLPTRLRTIARSRLRIAKAFLKRMISTVRMSVAMAAGKPLSPDLRVEYLVRVFQRASHRYQYVPIPVSATVFVQEGGYLTDTSVNRVRAAWESVTQEPVDLRIIPEVPNHSALFQEPYVGQLAAELNALLEVSQGKQPDAGPGQ